VHLLAAMDDRFVHCSLRCLCFTIHGHNQWALIWLVVAFHNPGLLLPYNSCKTVAADFYSLLDLILPSLTSIAAQVIVLSLQAQQVFD